MSNNQNDREDVKPWDLLNPNKERSSEELAEKRLNICYSCAAFKPLTQRCSKCGCFMKLKTQLEKAYCPLGKW
jgi:hypothetical protein